MWINSVNLEIKYHPGEDISLPVGVKIDPYTIMPISEWVIMNEWYSLIRMLLPSQFSLQVGINVLTPNLREGRIFS